MRLNLAAHADAGDGLRGIEIGGEDAVGGVWIGHLGDVDLERVGAGFAVDAGHADEAVGEVAFSAAVFVVVEVAGDVLADCSRLFPSGSEAAIEIILRAGGCGDEQQAEEQGRRSHERSSWARVMRAATWTPCGHWTVHAEQSAQRAPGAWASSR